MVASRPSLRFASLAFLLLTASCGAGGGNDGGVIPPDGGSAVVEVGTGENSFVELTDGDAVTIIKGPQGGYHIWTAVRAKQGLNPKGIEVKVSVLNSTGTELSLNAYRLNLTANGSYYEWYGLLGLVPVPADVSGSEVRLHLEVKDSAGVTATDERRVLAQGP
jgi:hypothetical protein